MTYQSEVLADAPVHYLRLDESTGTSATNLGSSGIAGTIAAGTLLSQPAAMDGSSMKFPNATAANVATATAGALASTFTVEVWHKRDTSITSNTNRALLRLGSGTTYVKLQLNPTTGQMWMQDNTAGAAIVSPNVTALTDDQWHHIAVTKTGTTFTFYVDGVSVGSASLAIGAKTTVFTVGSGTAAENAAAWLDEAAYYPTVLSPARILAHYQAAVPPSFGATIQAPAAVMNLTAPTGQVRIVNNDVKNTVPAMTTSLSAPSVTVKTASNVSVAAPAMALNLSAPSAKTKITKTVSASGVRHSSGSSASNYSVSAGVPIAWSFPATIPSGFRVTSATLNVRVTNEPLTYKVGVASNFATGTSGSGTLTDVAGVQFGTGEAKVITSGTWMAASTFTDRAIDVTALMNSGDFNTHKNIVIFTTDAGGITFNGTVSSLTYTIELMPAQEVFISAPAASLSLAMPQHRVGVGTTITATGAGSVNISMPATTVRTTKSPVIKAKAMTLTLQMPGGESRNPDQYIKAEPMEMWLFSPDAKQYISVPSINKATPIEMNLAGTEENNINLRTDRRVFVTTPMKMNMTMVGIYSEEGDRYPAYVPLTTDADDQWLKMDELSGDVAADALAEVATNGTYVGSPTLGIVGPQLRRAVRFDGLDDHIKMPAYPTGAFADMDLTIEFSIKTTQQNGTIIRGGGAATSNIGPASIYGGTADSEVRLVNGEIALYTGSGNSVVYRTRKFVADGEWHHVVISLPSLRGMLVNDFNISANQPFFVAIDGSVEWARYGTPLYGRSFIPTSVMARLVNGVATQNVAGDMRDFIVRYNYAVSQNTAQKLYYEWSNALVITAEPMEISIEAPAPHSVKGNVKRMLALYGLPLKLAANRTRDGFGNYYSVFAGFFIKNDGGEYAIPGGTGTGSLMGGAPSASNWTHMVYLPVKPFMLEGYMVYPTAIMHQAGSNGGPFSVPGMENGEYVDPFTKTYVDDKTGLPRFIDLDKDLRENITDFDALTVVNYPAPQPEDGPEAESADVFREPRQHNMGLTNSEWSAARDRLRDSIMSASYRGVDLWIAEPHFANHTGFIQGWDKHETGGSVEFFGAGNIDPTGYTNTRARDLDRLHINEAISGAQGAVKEPGKGKGQYNFTWQANSKRKIVALENGLTDIPGYEWGDRISWRSDNVWEPHSAVYAYDIQDKMNGLTVGDELGIEMWEQGDYEGNYPDDNFSVGDPRKYVISAKPQGIAGKIISREVDGYYGPNGVYRVNPWRANALTIAAERGTVVRGRPIAGRAFIEFMDTTTTVTKILQDKDQSAWKGETGKNVTSWSTDSRRYREIVILNVIESTMKRKLSNGDELQVAYQREDRYIRIEDRDFVYLPYVSMNARGLQWLQKADTLPAGAVKVYAPAMELSLAGTGVKNTNTRNTVVTVTGHMRMDAELRGLANIRGNDVREKALPMVMNLDMRGIGKIIKIDPIELSIETPDARALGDGDKIYVYMDAETNVTLFMKED